MIMMKKILVMLSLMMVFVLAGCSAGKDVDQTQDEVIEDTVIEDEATEDEVTEDEATEDEVAEDEVAEDEVAEDEVAEDEVAEDEVTEDDVDGTTMESIIDAMYEKVDVEWPKFVKQPLTQENMEYMLGVTNFEFVEGVVSEPMMTSQAHSIVLFTVDPSADIETIKADIKANVDGRKWICVAVEDENILVDHVGNHVILIMDEHSQELMDVFKEIMQ